MSPETRNLGLNWINASITADADHPLDNDRFNAFVDAIIKEKYQLNPDDISALIIESDKDWSNEVCENFVEKWFTKYENRL